MEPSQEVEGLYQEQAELLSPYVDLLLCETMSSAVEGQAAARVAWVGVGVNQPLPPWAYLAGRVGSAVWIATLAVVLMLGAGAAFAAGGKVDIDGERVAYEVDNLLWNLVGGYRISKQQSVMLAWQHGRTQVDVGTDYDSWLLSWAIAWGG